MTKKEIEARDQKIIEMRRQGMGYHEIARAMGADRRNITKTCKRLGVELTDAEKKERGGAITEEEAKERFEALRPDFEYVSGYKNNHSPILIRCRTCGCEFERIYLTCYQKKQRIQCPGCVNARKETAAAKVRFKSDWKEFAMNVGRFKDFSQIAMRACAKCGSLYLPACDTQRYCSDACSRRAHEKRRRSVTDAKRRTRMKAIRYDTGITLEDVYDRDHGVCWLCGELCQWEDSWSDERGNFIAGNRYPSIDHVKALANGGSHTWDNIRLAHRICNTKKGINCYPPRYNSAI